MHTTYAEAFAFYSPVYREQYARSSRERCEFAKADVLDTLRHFEQQSLDTAPPYIGKLYAELDAIRDRLLALDKAAERRKPALNPVRFRKATRERLYQRSPENTAERCAARDAMTDEFSRECVLGRWIDDGYCLDAPFEIPGGGHWQGGTFFKGRVYPVEVHRKGWQRNINR